MKEMWKPVIGFEAYYEVSSFGRVKSLYRHVIRSNGSDLRLNERILKPGLSGRLNNQYYMVVLNTQELKRTARVHRLMCESFYGINTAKNYVNHKDGNKLNNNLSNLEWCTSGENQAHGYKNGLKNSNAGERNGRSKLTEDIVLEVKRLIATDMKQVDIAKRLGLNVVRVNSIKSGRSWKHI